MPVRASDRVTLTVLPAPSYVRTFYLLQASTLNPPAKPTTNPPAAPWTTTEPGYTAGATNTLYRVELVAYGSVAFEYGDVQKVSAYEAAKQAYNLANQAATTVDGMRRVRTGVTQPATPASGWVNGDQWFVTNAAGQWIGVKVWNGTTFVDMQLAADSILVPGSVGNVQIKDGAIDGKTVTGATIQTAASGTRLVMDSLGLRAIDSFGATTATLGPWANGLDLDGQIRVKNATGKTELPGKSVNLFYKSGDAAPAARISMTGPDETPLYTTPSVSLVTDSGSIEVGVTEPGGKKVDLRATRSQVQDLEVNGNVWLTGGAHRLLPPGVIMPWAGTDSGLYFGGAWLPCDGSAISRTAYAALFAAIGTAYGAGNGTSTFNLPNMKGRIPVGLDATQTEFNTVGKSGGAKDHTLTIAQMPQHQHSHNQAEGGNLSYSEGGVGTVTAYTTGFGSGRNNTSIMTGNQGNSQPHNNLQPYVAMNYIIKT
ncbi:MAG: Tail Collar domain protein [Microbacterium sp.]|jgi:microcystin-dependent protein|nr:Tail Collar domain protein [Microbacterium sp.]